MVEPAHAPRRRGLFYWTDALFGTPDFEPVTPVTRQLCGFSHRAALLIKFQKVFYSVTG